mgnify:CR=1 FL=1
MRKEGSEWRSDGGGQGGGKPSGGAARAAAGGAASQQSAASRLLAEAAAFKAMQPPSSPDEDEDGEVNVEELERFVHGGELFAAYMLRKLHVWVQQPHIKDMADVWSGGYVPAAYTR